MSLTSGPSQKPFRNHYENDINNCIDYVLMAGGGLRLLSAHCVSFSDPRNPREQALPPITPIPQAQRVKTLAQGHKGPKWEKCLKPRLTPDWPWCPNPRKET